MKEVIEKHPEIKYLIVLMKFFLWQRSLNKTNTGGCGSFLLFCMIWFYLHQKKSSYQDKTQLNSLSLGDHLLEFLKYFGDFNVEEKEICTQQMKVLVKNSNIPGFFLREPLNSKNIGVKCH